MAAEPRPWRARAAWPLPPARRSADAAGQAPWRLASPRALKQPIPSSDLPTRFGRAGPRLCAPLRPPPSRYPAAALSLLGHAAVLATLLLLIRSVIPAPPPETTVALLFEPAAAPKPKAAPAPPAPAQPPPPKAAPPPVQSPPVPPQPVQPPPVQPPPVAPPAALAPPPPLPKPPPPPPPEARPRPAPPPVPLHPPPRRPPPALPPRPAAAAPAQPGPPAAPPAAAAPNAAPAAATWQQAVSAWLAAHRVYPEIARRRDEQGDVTVAFTVAPSGRVTRARVVRGSGYPRLDAAALSMLRDAMLPPFPPGMRQAAITIEVPIRYTLQD